jgi:hypothetical protein
MQKLFVQFKNDNLVENGIGFYVEKYEKLGRNTRASFPYMKKCMT